jgi:hypothetical protein
MSISPWCVPTIAFHEHLIFCMHKKQTPFLLSKLSLSFLRTKMYDDYFPKLPSIPPSFPSNAPPSPPLFPRSALLCSLHDCFLLLHRSQSLDVILHTLYIPSIATEGDYPTSFVGIPYTVHPYSSLHTVYGDVLPLVLIHKSRMCFYGDGISFTGMYLPLVCLHELLYPLFGFFDGGGGRYIAIP